MNNKFQRIDLYLVILGFIFRLLLSAFTRDPWDMDTWISIGSAIVSGQNPYALAFNSLVYPPLWGILCAIGYLAYMATMNFSLLYSVIKLPIIIADISICLLIRTTVYEQTSQTKKARTAMLLYLFNPVTIIFSALWGMFDAIPTLFAILSIYSLYKGNYVRSGLALGIGISFKGFFPGMLMPFFCLYIWRKHKELYKCLKYIGYTILVPLLVSIPFLLTNYRTYISSILFPANRLPQNLTYWFSIRNLLEISKISTTTISTYSSFFFLSSFFILYLYLMKKASLWTSVENPKDKSFLLRGTILIILIFFLTSSVVNEQYLIWLLPFLIVFIASYERSIAPFFYLLCGLDVFFIAINVGHRFFSPVIEMPQLWRAFQYSMPSMILMMFIGCLFSATCAIIFLKIKKWKEARQVARQPA